MPVVMMRIARGSRWFVPFALLLGFLVLGVATRRTSADPPAPTAEDPAQSAPADQDVCPSDMTGEGIEPCAGPCYCEFGSVPPGLREPTDPLPPPPPTTTPSADAPGAPRAVTPPVTTEPSDAPAWENGKPVAPGTSSSGSVKIPTGEFRWSIPFPTATLLSPRLSAQFYLVYRSQTEIDGITGNWDVTFNQRVVEDGNDVVCYTGTGRSLDRFTGNGSGVYSAPPGWNARLSRVNGIGGSGDSYAIEEAGGLVRTFDADGYLRLLSEPNGNAISFTRNSSDPHVVTQITDPLGRSLALAYTAGRLTSVTDGASRVWTLSYNQTTGYLASITSPSVTFLDGTGNTVTRGIVTSFYYTSGYSNSALNGNLTQIRDDAGNVVLANDYDSCDRCVVQANALGGQWFFDYSSGQTDVTAPDGFLTRYQYDTTRFITRIEKFTSSGMGGTALRTGEPTSYVTTRTRDTGCSCWSPATITGPDGTTWAFSRNGLGQVLSVTVTPGTGMPGSTATWSRTYASPYYPGYARVLTATDPLNRTRSFGYDNRGSLTSVAEPTVTLGQPSSQSSSSAIAYNSLGQVTTLTYPSGLVSQIAYSTSTHYLTGVTLDPSGLSLSTTYTRDAVGRVLTEAHPSGATWTRTYDALGHVLTETEPTGGVSRTYTYDFRGNVVRLDEENRDASGALDATNPYWTTTYAYNLGGLLTSTSVEKATNSYVTSTLSYDASGRVVSSATPTGRATAVTYDERGLQFQVTAAPGTSIAATQTYDYDLAGRLARVTNAAAGVQTFSADATGQLVSTTNEVGVTAQADYDLAGSLVQVQLRNASGTLVDRTDYSVDQRGRTYAASHKIVDGSGNVTGSADSSVLISPSGWILESTDPTSRTVVYTFDALGRISTTTSPGGDTTSVVYDADSRPTTVTHSETVPGSQTPFVWKETATFDALSRRTNYGRADASGNTVQSSQRAYDGRGNVVLTTDGVGNTVAYAWDGLQRLTSVMRDLRAGGTGAGQVTGTVTTGTAYDDDGFVTSQTDDNGSVTSYGWDARGRHTSTVLQGGATWSYTYDLVSRMTGWTDPNGTSVSQSLDAHGRLTARSITRATGVLGPTSESYTWDALDRVVSGSDNDSGVTFSYDNLGRLLSEAAGGNPAPSSPTTTFGYDLAARLTSIGYPDGLSISRSYDSDGRLDLVQNGSQTLADLDWTGPRVSKRTLGGGSLVGASSFDAIGRLTALTWTRQPANTTLRAFTYSWDAANRLRYEARADLSGQGDVYRYDSLARVVDSRFAVPNPAAEVSSPGSQSWTKNFAYALDGAMNRSSDVRTTWPNTSVTTNYSHDARNRYTAVGGANRTYSANGELLSDGTFTYAYDYRSRLVEVRNAGTSALVASYGWDPFDRRDTRAVSGGVTERWYYAGSAPLSIHETSGSGFRRADLVGAENLGRPAVAYVRDEGDLNGNSNTTETIGVLLAQNYAGSFIAATDLTGGLLESYTYDDFGSVSVWAPNGTSRSASLLSAPGRFQGMIFDPALGTYGAGVREYDPTVARWLQPDPGGMWGDPLGLGSESQAMVHSAPSFADPSGQIVVSVGGAGNGTNGGVDARASQLAGLVGGSSPEYFDANGPHPDPLGIFDRSGSEAQRIADAVKKALSTNKCQPVLIVAHSWGVGTAVRAAQLLKADGICVDALIAFDGVNGPPLIGPNAAPYANPGNITRVTNVMGGNHGLNGPNIVRFFGLGSHPVLGTASAPPPGSCVDPADVGNSVLVDPSGDHSSVTTGGMAQNVIKMAGERWARQAAAGKVANCCGACKK